MKSIAKKTLILGFAWVIGLLITAPPVLAQEPEPVPTATIAPAQATVTNS